MARVKSGFRKRFNIRYWRWMLTRACVGRFASLRRRYAFYVDTVDPLEAADEVLENRTGSLPTLFSAEETAFVRDRCWGYDTLAGEWAGEPATKYRQLAVLVRDAAFLGHVSRVLDIPRQAVILLGSPRANWNFAKAGRLRELPAIEERSHFLAFTDNYYHALFHDLVPLVDYLERLHPPGARLTVVVPKSPLGTLALGCEILANAYPGVTMVELPADARVDAKEALWLSFEAGNAEWTFADPSPVRRLAKLFRAHHDVKPGTARRVFFSRGSSKMRRLLNEDALWAIARSMGFERFEARADNHAEQVRVFSDARIMVGVHGAGLGNLAFCEPGTKVIEIFPENFTKSTYLWLSRRMGLDYSFLVGGPGDYDQAFVLDETAFRQRLEAALV